MSHFNTKNQTVHFSVHFSVAKKKTYSVNFYTGGVNISQWHKLSSQEKTEALNKEWYLRWSFRNPKTGKLERQTNIKGGVNRFHTKSERIEILKTFERNLIEMISNGYSPYNASQKPIYINCNEALEYALKVKHQEVAPTTYDEYQTRINVFKNYLKEHGITLISQIDKRIITRFLNQFTAKSSNNYKAVLSTIFSILSNESIIETNFIKELRPKKTKEKPTKIFKQSYIDTVTNLLKQEDPELLMFVNLISYMFWRPIEIVRIKVEDIDLNTWTIQTDTKTKTAKTKIIPEILQQELKQFLQGKQDFLFQLNAIRERDKRNYMTVKFKKFRERHKLDKQLTPYSFRHTYITKMYLQLRKSQTKETAIKHLSLITGHNSKAIYNYIHVNDVELPEDYSDLLK